MTPDLRPVRTLLIDADGNLFPSEEPAFVASTDVVNALMQELGAAERFEAEALRQATTGRNFRTTAVDLAAAAGATLEGDALERWVAAEKRAVTAHLRAALTPDAEVIGVLTRLERRYTLAAVSSSALTRLEACFAVTGLAGLLPPERRFSAEDSLQPPASKPDPAVYRFAARQLGIAAHEGLAVEDSVAGTASAVAAGFATVGNVRFVAPAERAARAAELEAAGAFTVVDSWSALEDVLGAQASDASVAAGPCERSELRAAL